MSKYLGDFKAGETVPVFWSSNEVAGGQVARSAAGTIRVYKGAPATPATTTTGVTDRATYNSKTGLNAVEIVTTDAFYAAGNDFAVVLEAATIDGETVTSVLAQFSIEHRSDKEMVLDALDTAVPGSPTADSINERVKAIDDKLPTGDISDFDEATNPVELLDTGGSAGTSAEELVDDIYNEALSGHVAGGSAGEALNRLDDIQTKTDLIPADPATETNVNANETKIDALQSDVTAIKTKTDNLPTDPASETNVDANETKIDALQTDLTAVKGQTDLLTFTGANVNAHVKAEDNIDFGSTKKASINAEVDTALDTAIPGVPTPDSINERIKAIDDKLPSGNLADQTDVAAIKAKTDNLPADPASETNVDANETKIDALQTDLTAVKAKTDNLPADPASETNVDANETKIDALQTDLTAVKGQTDLFTFTGANVNSHVKAEDNIDFGALKKASINTEVDNALDTAIPGTPTADSINERIASMDDRIPADPASETNVNANETKIDALQTDLTAVKAKTDNLPADPASETNVDANETKIDAVQTDVTAVKAKTDLLTFTGSNVHADTKALEGQALSGKTGDNFDTFFHNGDAITTKTVDDVGGGGGTDWTSGEKEEIRQALGVTGTKSATSGGNLDTVQSDVAAIKAKTDNLPADPASETNVDANETKIDAVQTDVTAIKAKTDNLPADPASETNVDANETKIDALQIDLTAVKAKTDNLPVDPASETNVDANEVKIDAIQGDVTAIGVLVTAVKAKTDNLPADPASETNVDANETKIDALQADVTAVKAKTDNLPADPASETNVDANETKIDALTVISEKIRKVTTNKVVVNGTDTQVDVYEDNGVDVAFSFTISGDRRTRTPI